MKQLFTSILILFVYSSSAAQAVSDSIVLHDLEWDKTSPAAQEELTIPSAGSLMAGFMYKANGKQKHPTLLLLHGYPGNERNLDLAQVVRAHGWNVIYFNYRGSWGSQGNFSFKNCVEDVVNTVSYCKKYSDSLQIDTGNIVLFGHSMGGWICLKALQQLPGVKKGFALSTWDIYGSFKTVKTTAQLKSIIKNAGITYFVLNTPVEQIFMPVLQNPGYYSLATDGKALANKQIIMLDEHPFNKSIADGIRNGNKAGFDYQVWQTDHPFTNKRVSLINKVLAFLDQ